MRTYTKREIADLLSVSPRTIADDAKFLNLTPLQGDRGLKLYNRQDFNLISQLRSHCADKANSRESFVPNTEVEVLDSDPEPAIYKLHNSSGEMRSESLRTTCGLEETSSLASLSIRTRHSSAVSESLEIGLSQDPLFDLEVLQRIADNHWLLPAARLAPLLGITPSYLNSKKTYLYCGFMASKEVYASNKALWRIKLHC
jgi:hypothetical protein